MAIFTVGVQLLLSSRDCSSKLLTSSFHVFMVHRRRDRYPRVETLRLNQVVYWIRLYFVTSDIVGKITNVLVVTRLRSRAAKEWAFELRACKTFCLYWSTMLCPVALSGGGSEARNFAATLAHAGLEERWYYFDYFTVSQKATQCDSPKGRLGDTVWRATKRRAAKLNCDFSWRAKGNLNISVELQCCVLSFRLPLSRCTWVCRRAESYLGDRGFKRERTLCQFVARV